jgi:hypothetical protein
MIGLDIILGGLTGLIGNAVTSWTQYKTKSMEFTHKENMVKLETMAMLEEAKAQISITKARIEGEVELAEVGAYKESIEAGKEKFFGEKWVDIMLDSTGWASYILKPAAMVIAMAFAILDLVRGMMRPLLTIYLTGLTSYITWLAWKILEAKGISSLSVTNAVDLYTDVISTVIYLTVSAITWWFGDRSMSKYLQNRKSPKPNQTGTTIAPF